MDRSTSFARSKTRDSRNRMLRPRNRRKSSPTLEFLEGRIVLSADVWTGASLNSSNWSDNANWQDGTAPTTGEDLIFPANAVNMSSVYDSALGVSSFGSIDIQSPATTSARRSRRR